MIYKIATVAFAICWLAVSCNNTESPAGGNGNGVDLFEFLVESDMSLSPDGEYVYYVGVDTALPQWSGIYRAEISNPARELVIRIDSISSPAVDEAGENIYFIKNNMLMKVRLADSSVSQMDILSGKDLHNIITLNDSLMIAWADASIFRINLRSLQVDSIGPGGYPSLTPCDSFLYLSPGPLNDVTVLLSAFDSISRDTLYSFDIHTNMEWPSYDCINNNIAYTIPVSHEWSYIYLRNLGDPGILPQLMDSTTNPRILKISTIHTIYTGSNGKLARISESGKKAQFTYRREESGK